MRKSRLLTLVFAFTLVAAFPAGATPVAPTCSGTPYIVVVGGSAAGGTTSTSDVRQYDPVADVMTTLTTDPWPGNTDGATLPGGAAVLGNKLYVFGGFDIGIGMTSAIYRFDPAAAAGSRWTTMTATLPNPIGYIPTAASGSLIYLVGGSGFAGGTLTDTTESSSYDPVADVIALITTIPRATGETRAVTAPDGSIWVLGGGRVAPNPSNEVDVYDPVGNAWSLGPPFSTARRNFPAGIDPVVGTIWATGGYDTSGTTLLAINEQFNPPGTWATRTSAPSPIVRAWGAFFPSNGKFYLMGGRSADAAGTDFTQVNIYDPVLDSWSMSTATFSDGQVNNMVGGVTCIVTDRIFADGFDGP